MLDKSRIGPITLPEPLIEMPSREVARHRDAARDRQSVALPAHFASKRDDAALEMPERGRNRIAFVGRADHDQTPCACRESGAEGEADHSPVGCAYDCLQPPNSGLIERRSKGFCLIGGRHRRRALSTSYVIDAKDAKPSSIDCAAGSDHVFPPSGRGI
jgi:hypothetical protein